MTVAVRLQPSGRQFQVERGETVLEAALRSGVSLNYSCNNGSCGECKARVISGTISRELPHDYALREGERAQGTVLLCSILTESDLVIEAIEPGAEDIPVQEVETTVYKLERVRQDIAVLHLRTPRSKTLRFLAGQHARIELDGLPSRHKSIASCPCNGMFLQFHVRRVAGDAFSEKVFSELKPRQKVLVRGPYGRFSLDEESHRPIIFIAYETGFAPIKSLIEHAIAIELSQSIHLYWLARRHGDHYLENHCRSWGDALENFVFKPIVADEAGFDCQTLRDETGLHLDALSSAERDMICAGAAVIGDHEDLSGFDVYVSGPDAVLRGLKPLLSHHQLPADRLFVDAIERI